METSFVAVLALIHVNLFHLLILGNKVVATKSRINYFSVASANSGRLSEVFSADRVNCRVLLDLLSIPSQKKEFCEVPAVIVASASWD